MGTHYTIDVRNDSGCSRDFCLYQYDASIDNPNARSVAWFAASIPHRKSAAFSWEIELSVVCGTIGKLDTGKIFNARAMHGISLQDPNCVDLTFKNEYYPCFENSRKDGREGTIYIHQDGTIPVNEMAVGVFYGLAGERDGGSATYLEQAQQDTIIRFTPRPRYWLAHGQFQPGQILDRDALKDVSVEVKFEAGTYDVQAKLDDKTEWRISRG